MSSPCRFIQKKTALALAVQLVCTGFVALPALYMGAAHAQTEQTSTELKQQTEFSIPAGTLTEVLNRFAEASGIYLSGDGRLTEGKNSAGLNGQYSTERALQQLLAGSGIQFSRSGKTVSLMAAREVLMFSPIRVIGTMPQRYEANTSGATMGIDVPLVDIPRSIQVVPEQVMLDQQAQDLRDVVRNISGVTSRNETGGVTDVYVLRGFETLGVLQDGVEVDRNAQRIQTANIERVEVIKGPTSNVLGRGYPGGIINVVSKKPREDSRKVISGTFDEFGRKDSQLDFTGPLDADGDVLYRLVLAYEDTETFRQTDHEAKVKRRLFAPSLTWNVTATDRLTYALEYLESELPVDEGAVAYLSPSTGSVIYSDRFERLGEHEDISDVKQKKHRLEYEHDLANGWLLSTQVHHQDGDYFSFRNNPSSIDVDNGILNRNQYRISPETTRLFGSISLSGNLNTGPLKHNFAVGIDYNKRDFESVFEFGTSTPISIHNPVYGQAPRLADFVAIGGSENVLEVKQLGVRVQDMITIKDNWVLSVGVRVDSYEHDQTFNQTSRRQLDESGELSPNVGLVYHASPYVSPYVSYSESFTTVFPQVNTSTGEFVNSPPSEGAQYEAGIKGSFADDRINYNLAYYDLSFTNVANGRDTNGAPIFDGEQESKGIEFDANIQFAEGLSMLLNLSHTDTKVVTGSRAGNELRNAPSFIGNLWLTYEHESGPLAGLGYGGGIRHVGKRFADANNTFELDSYTTVDLTAFYYLPIGAKGAKLRFQAGLQNVGDEQYHIPNSNQRSLGVGQPRTIYGSIGYEF